MLRICSTLLLTAALLLSLTLISPAPARAAPCRGWRFDADEPGIGARREALRNRRVIRCTFSRVAPAQTAKAISVARCESGLDDEASNGGRYLGLFQHARPYWPARARALPRPFPPTVSAFQSQANAWAAARMVRTSGWSAWSCA